MTQNNIKSENFYDVIIIGAGLSGLSAGYYLNKADKNIRLLIIETKDRVGGRTQTVQLKSSKNGCSNTWDVGGQWVTKQQRCITALLDELNINTFKQYDTGINILEVNEKISKFDSQMPSRNMFDLIDSHLAIININRNVSKINTLEPFLNLSHARKLDSTNLKDHFYKNCFTKTAKAIFDAGVRTIYGIEGSELNALFATMYIRSSGKCWEAIQYTDKDCAQENRVVGGTQQISKRLIESILACNTDSKLILQAPVIEINQENSDKVLVRLLNRETKQEEIYCCKKVISAIPLNCYRNIKLTPELPVIKRELLDNSKPGNYVKYIITYERAFWKEKGLSGCVISDGSIMSFGNSDKHPTGGPLALLYDATTYDGSPAILAFSCANQAVEWATEEFELRKNEIINALVRYYGVEASNYVDFYEKNWNHEEYNGGCPTINTIQPNLMQNYARAVREPYLNMHFAGTESATEWHGYMDGAIESGIRTANEVAYCLNKQNVEISYDYKKTYYYQAEEIIRLKEAYNRSLFKKKIFKLAISLFILSLSFLMAKKNYFQKKLIN